MHSSLPPTWDLWGIFNNTQIIKKHTMQSNPVSRWQSLWNAIWTMMLQILAWVTRKKASCVMQRGNQVKSYHAKHPNCKVRMNKKKWKAIHWSCLHMGQMILMPEGDLTVPKRQSWPRTGNENKSKQATGQKQPPHSGYSHLRTGRMCSTVGSMQL